MKYAPLTFFLVATFSSLNTAFAQPNRNMIQIEPLDSCLQYIISHHQAQKATEVQALAAYKEQKWYTLLPQPGLGYNFIINRPIVTLTMPDFISYINRKKDLKYRITKTAIIINNALSADTTAFKTAYCELQQLITFHNKEACLIANDSLLLQIKERENKKLQATSEDVLKVKISLLEKQYSHQRNILSILSKVAVLETYLHRTFRIQFPLEEQLPGIF